MLCRLVSVVVVAVASFSVLAEVPNRELFSYELPVSYQRGGQYGQVIKCEVSSRIVDGHRYYLAELVTLSGWNIYAGSRVEDAERYSADEIFYSASGMMNGQFEKQTSEFVLDPSNGRVRAVKVQVFDDSGNEISRHACVQNVSS